MTKFYDAHDRDLASVVALLEANGIEIFSSCEGGDDLVFPNPIIIIRQKSEYLDEQEIEIARILSENEYTGYYIKQVHAYQREPIPWGNDIHNGIEIEFWPISLYEDIPPFGDL